MTSECHDDPYERNKLVSHLRTPEAIGDVPADAPQLWVERSLADG